jgi:hypothetical protein
MSTFEPFEPRKIWISERERYIISQALYYGIKSLESVEPEVRQERSNIADMKLLRDSIFDYPDVVFKYRH